MKKRIRCEAGGRVFLASAGRLAFMAMLFLDAGSVFARPRPPGPPWPEMGIIDHLTFDEPFRAGASQTVDSTLYAESWSGYALRRSGPYVQPYSVPMLGSNSVFRVDPARGAFRLWLRSDWSSLSTGLGAGPGNVARLLTLVTTNGSASAVWWSLAFSSDGNTLQLVAQTETVPEVCMSVPVSLQAGTWHLIVLGYTETNSALYLDGALAASGGGLLPVPTNAAPYTSLVIGSSPTSGDVVGGQIEEVGIFSGNRRCYAANPLPFGLSESWEIAYYYTRFSELAALGPISDPEPVVFSRAPVGLSSAGVAMTLSAEAGAMEPLMAAPSCGTNDIYTVWMTNLACGYVDGTGWTFTFTIAGGTNGALYDVFSANALTGDTNTEWQWVTNGHACDTVTLTNQSGAMSFYILGTPLDSNGDGVTDAFSKLVLRRDPMTPTLLVSLASPTNSYASAEPATMALQAAVIGDAQTVEFLRDGAHIAWATNAPYQYSWPLVAAGRYSLSAIARGPGGLTAVSAPITVTVTNFCGF